MYKKIALMAISGAMFINCPVFARDQIGEDDAAPHIVRLLRNPPTTASPTTYYSVTARVPDTFILTVTLQDSEGTRRFVSQPVRADASDHEVSDVWRLMVNPRIS